jgi:hypothetical protein
MQKKSKDYLLQRCKSLALNTRTNSSQVAGFFDLLTRHVAIYQNHLFCTHHFSIILKAKSNGVYGFKKVAALSM